MNKLTNLFKSFFITSCLTLSGGIAMLPQIQKDLVEKYKYMTEDEFVEALAVAQSLPGPVIYNFAIACGKKIAGYKGVFVCGMSVVFPAFAVMLLITILFKAGAENIYVKKAMMGVQAAAGAIIIFTAFQLGKKILKHWYDYVFMIVAFVLMLIGTDVVWVLVAAAFAGYLVLRFQGRGAK